MKNHTKINSVHEMNYGAQSRMWGRWLNGECMFNFGAGNFTIIKTRFGAGRVRIVTKIAEEK